MGRRTSPHDRINYRKEMIDTGLQEGKENLISIHYKRSNYIQK